jgi:outer membrane receptor protein involved in Fe transport
MARLGLGCGVKQGQIMQNTKSGTRARLAIWPVLLASTVLTGLPAYAQVSGGIETVTVTAEKRSEDLQKVPMNVQALTAQKLEDLHLSDFTDFVKYMPSVTWASAGQGGSGGPGFANITMRGIASDQNGNHSGPQPTVGVYFDEQPITTINGTLDIPTYDVQRVEALSGPQGTLYGASSLSGTIRIISNKPDASGFAADYQVGVNTVSHGGVGYQGNGMVNIPLTDNIALRVVAWDEHDAGYIDNVPGERTYPLPGGGTYTINNAAFAKKNYNTVDKIGGRAALEFDLPDDWTITPTIMAQSERSDGFFGSDPSVGDLAVTHFEPEYTDDKWYQAALAVQGKIAGLDVLYSGGYMHRIVKAEADYSDYTYWYDQLYGPSYAVFNDGSGNQINPTQLLIGKDGFTKQSHEVRVSTPKDGRLRLTGGLFYERQTHHIIQDYVVPGFVTADPTPAPVTGWPGSVYLADEQRVDRDEAAFIDGAFDILPDLTLNAGIRFFSSSNSLKGFFGESFYENRDPADGASCLTSSLVLQPPTVPGTPCTDVNSHVKSSGETHRVNLTWQVTDDKMVYATYSTGFRPGGANRLAGYPGYTPDTLDNYEVGWKTSWDDNHLRWNATAYWENWNNIQFSFLVPPNSITAVKNAGTATVKGIETDFTYLPIENLTLTAAGAFNQAALNQDYCQNPSVGGVPVPCTGPTVANGGVVDAPAGTRLPITPRWKLNGTARYEWPMGNYQAHVQGSFVYQSGEYPDLRLIERAILGETKPSTTFDFTTGIDHDNWSLELSVLNVTDERAQVGRFPGCNPDRCGYETYLLFAQPRTIGLTFGQKF